LQAPVLQLQGQQAGQDHKSLHLRGLQLERVLADHPKVQAVAQMVLVLPDLVLRAAQPIAPAIRQARDLPIQVMAARLHPFGVKTQVKTRLFRVMTARHTPKRTHHRVLAEHLKLTRKHLLHLNGRQVPIKAPHRSNPHQALRLKHPNQGPLAQLQALSRPVARRAITVFRPIISKVMGDGPRH
jgi:hypothetical protein